MAPLARRIVGSQIFRGFIIAVILFAGVLEGVETDTSLMARHGALLHALDELRAQRSAC